MKRLLVLVLCIAAVASAQAQQRIRGAITGLSGDVLSVKLRDGRDVQVQLAPDTQVAVTQRATADDFKPGSFVGVTSTKGPDGRLVAHRVHALGPQVPSGHNPNWDSMPNSLMTNANLEAAAQVGEGRELTLKYKDGEQKILVTPKTEYYTFTAGSRADLKPGESIFTNAKPGGENKFVASRIAVSKDGANPPQ
jgi:outer membrane lipoprotein SlyB